VSRNRRDLLRPAFFLHILNVRHEKSIFAEEKRMKRKLTTISIVCAALLSAAVLLQVTVHAQANPTPVPEVETAVAATQTALAPTFDSIRPTTPPSPTATLTPSPTRTPTPTRTLTPTLSIEEQVGLTITAIFIDETTLKVWVEKDDRTRHPWHDRLPADIRASRRAAADLIVTIEEKRVYHSSQNYYRQFSTTVACTSKGYRIVYVASLFDPAHDLPLATTRYRGSAPSFPASVSSCSDKTGNPPAFTREFVNWLTPYAYLYTALTPTPTPFPTDAAFSPHTRFVTSTVGIHKQPKSGGIIGRMDKGDSFVATNQTTDEKGQIWYSLTYGGQTAWVQGWLTSTETPSE
jgi:hypothetical protein